MSLEGAQGVALALADVPGVTVVSVDSRGVGIVCETGADRADAMQAIARFGAPGVAPMLKNIVAYALGSPGLWNEFSDKDKAAIILVFVQSLRWEAEKGEIFQLPAVTVRRGGGDCDCLVILFVALCIAAGIEARAVVLSSVVKGQVEGLHASAQVKVALGLWLWAECSVRCFLGDDPRELAKRKGLILSGHWSASDSAPW